MKLKVKLLKIKVGKPVAFINKSDAEELNLFPGDRVDIISNDKTITAVADIVEGFLDKGEIALSEKINESLSVKNNHSIFVNLSLTPKSSSILQKEVKCEEYTKQDLISIMNDIVNNRLTEAEIAYFISGVNHCGMSLHEIKLMTEAIFESGNRLVWNGKKVVDKHSIGGIPGNRTTPIVVPICAALGVFMPKTSSRAITSAAGTADVIETIARVDFSAEEIKKILKKTNACMVWGGSLGLAPADDKLIQIEKILNLDPEPQLLASILAKKLAVGSKYVLIDIPAGKGAKVSNSQAKRLKNKFLILGNKIGLKIKVIVTNGSQPIGNGVGPVLEMHDILRVLKRENSPKDLEEKSLLIAGEILEMVGIAKKGFGKKMAKEALYSGKALKKFEEIIKAQGGKVKSPAPAKFSANILADKSGKISLIKNKIISHIARLAGCPSEKSAGLYIYKHKAEKVKNKEILLTIYSNSKQKLNQAVSFCHKNPPIEIK